MKCYVNTYIYNMIYNETWTAVIYEILNVAQEERQSSSLYSKIEQPAQRIILSTCPC